MRDFSSRKRELTAASGLTLLSICGMIIVISTLLVPNREHQKELVKTLNR